MSGVGLAELLEEMEHSPGQTELVDIEQLFLAAGYERLEEGDGIVLFVHQRWGSRYTLDASKRFLPVTLVVRIAEFIRARATAEEII